MASGIPMFSAQAQTPTQSSLYEFSMKDIDGKDVSLENYRGKVVLIVNVASKCGNTPQYKDLEAMYRKYKDQGFVILGFPANNFLYQEPGTDAEIKEFCSMTYGVTFDMFSKISVKGKDQHPLYTYLTSEKTNPKYPGEITWNFEKFLVDRKGNLVGRFAPKMKPSATEVVAAVESALKQN
jgi:glutathione peroxidase